MVYYILVGIFSSNLLYHKKDCFPTLLRVVAVFFIARFFTAPCCLFTCTKHNASLKSTFLVRQLKPDTVQVKPILCKVYPESCEA